MKNKGSKRIPIPRKETIDNSMPTSLFFIRSSCTQIASPVPTNNSASLLIYPEIASPLPTSNSCIAH